jgi:hypothetical protein
VTPGGKGESVWVGVVEGDFRDWSGGHITRARETLAHVTAARERLLFDAWVNTLRAVQDEVERAHAAWEATMLKRWPWHKSCTLDGVRGVDRC